MHGIKSAGLSLGRGAVICGAGPIGLIALAAARASGAHPLVITDLEPKRLDFVKKFVPSVNTYQVNRTLDAQGNAKKIRELFDFENTGEYGAPETVLGCTGVESSVVTAAYTARRGGTVMVIGVGREIMNNLPFMNLSLAEVYLLASFHISQEVLLTQHIDRSQVHRPLPRYLTRWLTVSGRRYLRSEAAGQSYIPVGKGNGCAAYVWGLD
jgi:threonine dehydrogenase-like Zn-dependent dehydrogenase